MILAFSSTWARAFLIDTRRKTTAPTSNPTAQATSSARLNLALSPIFCFPWVELRAAGGHGFIYIPFGITSKDQTFGRFHYLKLLANGSATKITSRTTAGQYR